MSLGDHAVLLYRSVGVWCSPAICLNITFFFSPLLASLVIHAAVLGASLVGSVLLHPSRLCSRDGSSHTEPLPISFVLTGCPLLPTTVSPARHAAVSCPNLIGPGCGRAGPTVGSMAGWHCWIRSQHVLISPLVSSLSSSCIPSIIFFLCFCCGCN